MSSRTTDTAPVTPLSLDQIVQAASLLLQARDQADNDGAAAAALPFCHPSSYDYEPFLPHCSSSSNSHRNLGLQFPQHETTWAFYITNVGGAMLCIAAVALIAGLFLGYLTLDAFDLRIIQRASVNLEERVWAETILPIVVERHRVLVTLLILNGLAYETCELNAYLCVFAMWLCSIIKNSSTYSHWFPFLCHAQCQSFSTNWFHPGWRFY